MKNRFKVEETMGMLETKLFSSLQDVVSYLSSNNAERGLRTFLIECKVDDIQITSDELLQVWELGERPTDLQMF
jgi:hypothetical protein